MNKELEPYRLNFSDAPKVTIAKLFILIVMICFPPLILLALIFGSLDTIEEHVKKERSKS
jgi:hypothetical protein